MTSNAIAKVAAEYPVPIFSGSGEVAEVTIAGQSYVFVSTSGPAAITGGLKDFTIFDELPREMRTKIWGYCVEGRIITAVENPQQKKKEQGDAASSGDNNSGGDFNGKEPEADPLNSFYFIGAGYPRVFQVCKEVKELAGGMGYKKSFVVKGSSKAIYFNSNMDTLVLDTAIRRDDFLKQVPLYNALVTPIDLELIQTLRIQLPSFVCHYESVIDDMKQMVSLRDLTLVGSCDVAPTQPGLTLKLRYDFDGKGAVPSARTQLPVRLVGEKSINKSLKNWIPSTDYQTHLFSLNKRVTGSMQNSDKFPSFDNFPRSLKVEVTYFPEKIDDADYLLDSDFE